VITNFIKQLKLLLKKVQNVQVSDTTGDDQNYKSRSPKIKYQTLFYPSLHMYCTICS